MHPTVVIKSVLVVMVLGSAATFNAQASNFVNESSRMDSSRDAVKSQVGVAPEATSGSGLIAYGKGREVASVVADTHLEGAPSAKSNSVTHESRSTGSVKVPAGDGLMASVSSDQSVINPDARSIESNGISTQQKAVPISAVVWLFSSALFGFVVVANRRKV
ncbi:hypothetical protein [Pseudomonas sp. NPDC089569]|uniref:hypothetical protein n=1 Tax=Pseudomonas sp. NPDC089569 TaxID=3390722 RepID=UPI003CFFDA35